ncbi:hypothetical protein PYW07_010648 [Mythimna separata]|uniref:Dolichol phosphate-mannose biosynthesis regulatory protein n=1 Tax=Mythimna separata TaxID=271217 RepID=A0AAD8DLW2_MYTSE|nr:hypothetical protein PYW07_010648 [Mythimna separata]
MDIPDAVIGRLLLVTTSALFVLFSFWVNSYPFIDDDSPLFSVVSDPAPCLLCCGAFGLCFVGGLMSFTLYHLLPHL